MHQRENKFRDPQKAEALLEKVEKILKSTKQLKVVCDNYPTTGYEKFPKALDFHGPSVSSQNRKKIREIESRFNVKFDDDLATYYGGVGESVSSAFYGGGRRGLSSPLASPSSSPTTVGGKSKRASPNAMSTKHKKIKVSPKGFNTEQT